MLIESITEENFASIMRDESMRNQLLAAMRKEEGVFPPLLNHVSEVASRFVTSTSELDNIVDVEVAEKREDFLCDIIFHPRISESALFHIYEAGLCIVDLAHLAGSFRLLERIAEEHRVDEAIMTLLIDYFAAEEFSDAQFTEFVQKYRDIPCLQYNLKNKETVPERKRRLGLSVINEQTA